MCLFHSRTLLPAGCWQRFICCETETLDTEASCCPLWFMSACLGFINNLSNYAPKYRLEYVQRFAAYESWLAATSTST